VARIASPSRFLWAYVITVSLAALSCGLSAVVLWRAHELSSYRDDVALQQRQHALLGLATFQNFYEYKLSLVAARRSPVLALGSSRIMQLREELFVDGFTNAGGAMNSAEQGRRFLEALPADYHPQLLMLGVDFWWFRREWSDPGDDPRYRDPSQLSPARLRHPYLWLADPRMGIRRIVRLVVSGNIGSTLTSQASVGVQAMVSASGFRPDGSYQYGDHYFGTAAEPDVRFGISLGRIDRQDTAFGPGTDPDPASLSAIDDVLRWAAARHVRVAMFLPPVAPPVRRAMIARPDAFGYVVALTRALEHTARASNVEFYDFLWREAPEAADPCEYVDGIHGGDVVFGRMLLAMAAGSMLAQTVDRAEVRHAIDVYRGHTVTPLDGVRYARPEADFLRLGCVK
jgi:hypothetical protein